MKNINTWLPWASVILLYVLQMISSFYHFAKTNDPELADKLKHVGTLADWAVANQGRFNDKSGHAKFEDAVKDLTKQGVSEEVAKGAVQYAYDNTTPQPVVTPKVEPIVEAKPLPAEEIQPVQSVDEAQPVEDNNAVLDDLEVNNDL